MPAISAREPGIAGVALTDARLTAGIILDGLHVDPLLVRAAFAAKARNTIALVSDAMPTVGTALDHFELMSRRIRLQNGRLTSESRNARRRASSPRIRRQKRGDAGGYFS